MNHQFLINDVLVIDMILKKITKMDHINELQEQKMENLLLNQKKLT